LTPREARKYFDAYKIKKEREFQMTDTTNYILGKYISLAVNDPKKYPKKPASLDKSDEQGQMTEADEAQINAFLGALASKSENIPSPELKRQEQPKNEEITQE
jgi:hypothetical protein